MIFQYCLTTIFLATTLCLLFDTKTCSANPGARVQVTQKAFDYATGIGIDQLYEKLKNTQIPDVGGKYIVHYRISDLKLTTDAKPTGHVTLLPGRGLKWHVLLNNLHINGKYRLWKSFWFFTLRKSASIDIFMKGTRVEVTLLPTKTNNGGLNIAAADCSVGANLKMTTNSWYLRIILFVLNRKTLKKIKTKICKLVVSAINDKVAPRFTNFPMTHSIADNYVLDYSLVSNPVISRNYLQTNHKAIVYYGNDTKAIPFTPMPLPIISDNNKMLYFEISDYVFNTWLFAAHRNNFLSYELLPGNLPEEQRELFQTSCPTSFCIGTVIPKIAAKFPNKTIRVTFSTSDRPQLIFQPHVIQMSVPTMLGFNIVQPNKTSVNAITIFLTLSLQMNVRFNGSTIYFSVIKISFTLGKVTGAYAGKYDMKQFQQTLQMVSDGMIPYFNELGNNGLPLALPTGVSISNSEIRVAKNAIILGTDLQIGPI